MKKLIKLYDIAKNEHINVKKKDFKEFKANGLCLYNAQKCNIYLNKNIETETEEKCVLAEEIGHYKTGIDFNLLSDTSEDSQITRSINEFRAKKWAVNELIPFKVFKGYLDSNYSKYEVANEIGVTEEMLDMAYFIYEPMLYDERM